jgi:hypothetical protein
MLAGPLHHLQVNQPHPQQSRAALENGTAGELVSVGSPTASAGGKERDFSLVRIRTTVSTLRCDADYRLRRSAKVWSRWIKVLASMVGVRRAGQYGDSA